jgi:hypothetical protein
VSFYPGLAAGTEQIDLATSSASDAPLLVVPKKELVVDRRPHPVNLGKDAEERLVVDSCSRRGGVAVEGQDELVSLQHARRAVQTSRQDAHSYSAKRTSGIGNVLRLTNGFKLAEGGKV